MHAQPLRQNENRESAADQGTRTSHFAYAALPYLLTACFPFAILVGNVGNMPSIAAIAATIGGLLVIVALFDALLRLFVRRSPCRELLSCEVLAFVMAYGYVAQPLRNVGFRQVYFLPVWSILFLTLAILTITNARNGILARIASLLQCILVAMVSLQTIYLGAALSNEYFCGTIAPEPVVDAASLPAVPPANLPDIYYILVDGYGREDVLRDSYQFDNHDFLKSLRERGFYVADQSRPNYSQTALSICSSLNMRYLDEQRLDTHKTRWPLHSMIQHNEVVRCLKQNGYEAVAVQSGYPLTECPSFDRYISICPFMLDEFQLALFRTTCLCPLEYWASCWLGSAYTSQRRLVLGTFAMIPKAIEGSSRPCFVFAHILSPHPPFVFDAQGNPVDPATHTFGAVASHREYVEQLAFTNRQLRTIVDAILSSTHRPSVIILQGDHGPGTEWFRQEASFSERLHDRFGILNAIYLPPGVDAGLYDTMTPVNTFRLILDRYFHTNLGRIEDRCYFSEYAAPYAFLDVSPQLTELIADRRR